MSQLSLINTILELNLTNEEKISLVKKINSLDSNNDESKLIKELKQETNFCQCYTGVGNQFSFERTYNNNIYNCVLVTNIKSQNVNITVSNKKGDGYNLRNYVKRDVPHTSKWVMYTNNTNICIDRVASSTLVSDLNFLAEDIFIKYGDVILEFVHKNQKIDEVINDLQRLKTN